MKYSPLIEAAASLDPLNPAKDLILQASVSETMVFYEANPSRTRCGNVILRTTFGNLYDIF